MAETETKIDKPELKIEPPVSKGEVVVKKAELVAMDHIRAIVPRNIEEAFRYATAIVKGGLAPDSYENDPNKIMLGIMKAMEVGLPPLTGLANIMIVNNRATVWGDAALALVQSKGQLQKFEIIEIGKRPDEGDETVAFHDTYGYEAHLWRKGQDSPYIGKFTVGDAKRAKLWMNPKKAPWMQHPKRMLKIRTFSPPLRDGFADCLSGLAIREEVEDLPAPAVQADTAFLDDGPKAIVDTGGQPLTGLEGG